MNYKMTIAYDGSRFNGWQSQKGNDNTIQALIEKTLSDMLGEKVEINGSGRTDAGVHAKGQVANFRTAKKIDKDAFLKEINDKLPSSVAVKSIEEAEERFHARLNAKGKTYEYTIWKAPYNNAFSKRFAFECYGLDVEKMRQAASLLIGTHDFLGFSSLKKSKKSTVRTINAIDIKEDSETIKISYTGNGFLYNMVRIMTGTLIEVGEGKREAESIKDVLDEKDRSLAGFTAQPQGLCLMDVFY